MGADQIDNNAKLGSFSLAFIGLSAMLGSGWLLASYFVFQQAGTYSMYSWLLGFVMVMVVALSFAETCSVIYQDGATVILPRVSHGYFLSSLFGFFGLVSWVALIPVEVSATLQYLTHFVKGLYFAPGKLTGMGYMVAFALAIAISIINSFSMNWIKRMNNYIFTPIKIGIPIVIIAYGLYFAHINPQQVISHTHSLKGIFTAIPLGVIFSFNAFKTVCVISGRAKNPRQTILRALVISLTLCLILYAGLQLAFDSNATGYVLAHRQSPYAAILKDSTLMLLLLYISSISSPFTANVFNLHAGSACLFRMSKLEYVPKFFSKTNRYGQYIFANFFNVVLAMLILARGNAWDTMVNELTCVMVITYAAAPIALAAFRKSLVSVENMLRFKHDYIIGLFGFVFSNFMIYWCGYNAIKLAIILMVIISVFTIIYHRLRLDEAALDFMRAIWVFFWLGGIALVSYFSVFGGNGKVGHIYALVILTIMSVIMYVIITKTRLPEKEALANLEQLGD